MTGMLYSLIIPAYNAEKTIGRCLVSALEQLQGSPNVEVIVVDDGSTDGTANTARLTAERYPEVITHVISQANAGVSAARNAGIASAKSAYLGFMDGDDFWLPEHWQEVSRRLTDGSSPDIVEFNAITVDQHGTQAGSLNMCLSGGSNVVNVDLDVLLRYAALHKHFPWARVYRAGLFESRLFPVNRHYEDNGAMPWMYAAAHRLSSINKPLLAYTIQDGNSITGQSAKIGQSIDLASYTADAMEEAKHSDSLRLYWYLIAARAAAANHALIRRLRWSHRLRALRVARRIPKIPYGCVSNSEWVKLRFPALYFLFLSLRSAR
ncbi:glycosyltransferase family 2 protein [Robbsia sp. Bb-Pol-6]|uniref:Glycosyltransferase family 2 protein n=1 Tax=Robbsia betulipollinis TaxID=2981849 RepID=A0ABT3ZVC6_9BURK|nr:glycosyltransferase family 2 protein [Robbsia betulipollinis]MCY0389793.1 glycosyltransferase family 2 protein [Robbsia betulipollinis]